MREIKIRAYDPMLKEFLPLAREVAFIDDEGRLRTRIEGIIFNQYVTQDRNDVEMYVDDIVQLLGKRGTVKWNTSKPEFYVYGPAGVDWDLHSDWQYLPTSSPTYREGATAMMEHTLTIRFEVHDGDVTKQFLWPLGKISITEVVQVSFSDGEWTISNVVGDVPFAGRGEYKNQAILNYLSARLGLTSEEDKQP